MLPNPPNPDDPATPGTPPVPGPADDDHPSGRTPIPPPDEESPSQRHRGLDSDDDIDPDVYEDTDDIDSDDDLQDDPDVGDGAAPPAGSNPTAALLNALAEGFGLLEQAREDGEPGPDGELEIGEDGRPVLRAIARPDDEDADGEEGGQLAAVLPEEVAPILEALLFVSATPLTPDRLRDLMGLDSIIPIRRAADRLRSEYESRGRSFELVELSGGYILQTRSEFESFVTKLRRARQEQHMTHAALVSLAIIAYKQPITRSEIDSIRGAGSTHHIRNLMERDLIRVVGRKHAPGYPSLYGTTSRFLRQFGLRSLRDLPQEADFAETDVEAMRGASREDLHDGEGDGMDDHDDPGMADAPVTDTDDVGDTGGADDGPPDGNDPGEPTAN